METNDKKEENLSPATNQYNREETKTIGKEEPAITKLPKVDDNPEEHKHHPVTEQEKTEEFKKQNDEAVEIGTQ